MSPRSLLEQILTVETAHTAVIIAGRSSVLARLASMHEAWAQSLATPRQEQEIDTELQCYHPPQ